VVTRIVGGTAGGRRLVMPRGRDTRPTSERTREGLFSALSAAHRTLHGRAFLDLYAGSGAVGLEAASRGSAPVLLVEHAPGALAALRNNVAALQLDQVEVVADQVERVLARPGPRPFDVVFLDPPYADPVEDVLGLLAAEGWLAPSAIVVVERSMRDAEPGWPHGMEPDRSRRYGDTMLWYGLWYGRRP